LIIFVYETSQIIKIIKKLEIKLLFNLKKKRPRGNPQSESNGKSGYGETPNQNLMERVAMGKPPNQNLMERVAMGKPPNQNLMERVAMGKPPIRI
jgi:hypothetical protein